MKTFLFIVLAIIALWGYGKLAKHFKAMNTGNTVLITGAVKAGKTTVAVWLASKLIKSAKFWTKVYNKFERYILYPFYCWFTKFKLANEIEEPVLYSNIPLSIPYVPLSKALIMREERPVPHSICFIDESSLLADSMFFKDADANERIMLFNKLWGHASHGGVLIYDTQSVNDNHFAVRRCLNSYFYVHHNIKIPFFVIAFIREERYTDDGTAVNSYNEDVEKSLLIKIIPKKVWKYFDTYCYSSFTDDKPVRGKEYEIKKQQDLKVYEIVSFKKYRSIPQEERSIEE